MTSFSLFPSSGFPFSLKSFFSLTALPGDLVSRLTMVFLNGFDSEIAFIKSFLDEGISLVVTQLSFPFTRPFLPMAWFSASPSPEVCSLLRSLVVIVFLRGFPCRIAFIRSLLSEGAEPSGGEVGSGGADGDDPGGRDGGDPGGRHGG